MKTTNSMTPAKAGLSISIVSGPRGAVIDDWPCIEYTVELKHKGRVVWRDNYRLGIGHVKWPSLAYVNSVHSPGLSGFTDEEKNVARIHARGQALKKTRDGLQIEASAAAKLAIKQKVTPALDNVCHSLLLDGAAFFDSQRFEDWASEFGYDPDSRKAEAVFRACDDLGRAISRALARETLDALREWASNH